MKTLRNIFIIFLIIFLTSILSITLYSMYIGIEIDYTSSYDVEKIAKIVEKRQEESENIEELLEKATESIVGISKLQNVGDSAFIPDSERKLGLGSGVIVTENGYILTNEHVSGNKLSNCYVTLKNGKDYKGQVVWTDTDLDLSIVKINATGLEKIKIGNSDNIKIAEPVYAIGNPVGFEFQRTVTSGIISGLNRTIKLSEDIPAYMEDLIQTDATINQGNSGGALIDSNGNMIGINTVKITSAEGMGFAIPINMVIPIIKKFENNNEFNEAYLGIYGYDKNVIPYLETELEFDEGVYVAQVVLDGPCYNAGIRDGDIIINIDNIGIDKMSILKNYIYTKEPNDEVELTVLRDNIKFKCKVKLERKI